MAARREKFSSQAAPELLAAVREIARQDGRHFQAVLEDALRQYIQDREGPKDPSQEKVRPEVMAHFRASVEKNRRLYELLAQ